MVATNTRLVIACTSATVNKMNSTLNGIDPTSTGDVMRAELVVSGTPGPVVGRWASWAMPDSQRSAILAEFARVGWAPLRGSEGLVLGRKDPVPAWGTQRFWLFDGLSWQPHEVLSTLDLETAPVVDQ